MGVMANGAVPGGRFAARSRRSLVSDSMSSWPETERSKSQAHMHVPITHSHSWARDILRRLKMPITHYHSWARDAAEIVVGTERTHDENLYDDSNGVSSADENVKKRESIP